MIQALRQGILSDSAAIAEAMRSTGLLYQSLVRDPELRARSDESNSDARWRLAGECRENFLREPHTVARRLQIAGYEPAAEALRHLARQIKRFSLTEISWSVDDDDSGTLEIDVEGAYERVTDELRRAERISISQPVDADLAVLIEAANLADALSFLADDYLLYFEGWMPAGYNPGETDDERMWQVRDEHDGLQSVRIVQKCDSRGYLEISDALSELIALTSSIVHLPPTAYPAKWLGSPSSPGDGQEIDTEQMRSKIDSAHEVVITSIFAERDKFRAPEA
jgi:hypothetical protein